MYFDMSYLILVLPAVLLAMWAQSRVSSAFRKYSGLTSEKGYTGAEVAQALLASQGVTDVKIERTAGNLTDHYDPRTRTLRLSEAVHGSRSIAAIGVAAHETGHAIQHDTGYVPLGVRNGIFPVVNIGSRLSVPLIILGFFLSGGRGSIGMMLIQAGIIMFSVVVFFQLVTLPVEFNASARAIDLLAGYNILNESELGPAKKVLNAAALTYVASALVAVTQLIRFLLLSQRRR